MSPRDPAAWLADLDARVQESQRRQIPRRLWQENLDAAYGVPVGTLRLMAGSSVGVNELLCNGQAVARVGIYGALFAEIGTTWGAGDGTNTFNVPDFRGRVPVGADAGQPEFAFTGRTGGEKAHVLTIAEMPSHSHGLDASNQAAVVYRNDGTGNLGAGAGSNLVGWNTTQGGGGAHNNLQPYGTVNVAIRF